MGLFFSISNELYQGSFGSVDELVSVASVLPMSLLPASTEHRRHSELKICSNQTDD